MTKLILGAVFVVTATLATAGELHGVVVGVTDGDTITVLDSAKNQHKIRLAGIDAPERGQAFGERSKQNLSRMLFNKTVEAHCHKRDRYGREICKVWTQSGDCPTCGMTLDVGYAQISAGMAWWYRQYANEQSKEDRGRYESEEGEARLRKRGLWRGEQPVPPWEFRRRGVAS